ncbi:serine/threonine protein kinase [Nannocystis bainbridge]|uniref:Protein kinase n=1 Tax=Nannocystis bainbridge TaxID=2995303 RepID=A0ABT5DZ50_9BACT|nr:serine/threonine-protein kinase [Nannocystis bainbridge]MDC0718849.1 protein kinase [Nannocystis bainbridge]
MTNPPEDITETVLEGRYRVLQQIGHGGMSSVYAGEDTRLRRRCAIKVLSPRLAAEPEHVERFLREAQMIASLQHPNIVDIYSYGEDPAGWVYFVMELLTGEDLDSRLQARAERPFGVAHCCLWALQVAEAVAVVHEAGLVHRDLKAANVFLARRRDGTEVCKLLDFGIARVEDGPKLTRTGVTLGTPSYMSPEQVRNDRLDGRSDVYSFGVLLFKLLTGRVPFVGAPMQVAMAQCESPPPRPTTLASGIPPNLEDIVLTALAKRPEERFQSMRALASALRSVLAEEAPELAGALQSAVSVTLAGESARAVQAATATLQDGPTPGSPARQGSMTAAMSPRGRMRPLLWVTASVGVATVAVLVTAALRARAVVAEPGPAEAGSIVEAPREPSTAASAVPAIHMPRVSPTDPGAAPVPAEAPAEPQNSATAIEREGPQEPPPNFEEALPPLSPELPASREATGQPSRPASDPLRQIEVAAKKCRKKHKAVGGPKIEVDYAVGSSGEVIRAVPATADPLGRCLADAVRATRFAAKIVLGRKVSL